MNNIKLGVIGYGNMASSLIEGWIKNRILKLNQIYILSSTDERDQKAHQQQLNVLPAEEFYKTCSVILVATKPQNYKSIEVPSYELQSQVAVVSIMAGVTIKSLESHFKCNSVVRAMPNLPAKIGMSATAYHFNSACTSKQKTEVTTLLEAAGLAFEIQNEEHFDAVTALSGSGVAFLYEFMKQFVQNATKAGLEEDVAQGLFLYTMLGSVALFEEEGKTFDELINSVKSKKGTTEAGLDAFSQTGFAESIQACFEAAANRSKELSQ